MIFWYSIPFLIILLPLSFLQYFYHVNIEPTYNYNFDILQMMSVNGNYLNALTFSNGFWEKVVFTDVDKALILTMVAGILSTFLIFRPRNTNERSLVIAATLTFALLVTFELGYNNGLYRIIADPNFSLSWILRDPFKISLAALGLFLFLSALAIRNLLSLEARHIIKVKSIFVWGLMIPLVISIILWGPVQKTSEILAPTTIPDDYAEIASLLERSGNHNVLSLPDSGNSFTWAENKNVQSSFLAMTDGGNIGPSITANAYGRQLLQHALETGDSSALGFAVQAVVIDESFEAPKYQSLIKDYLSKTETQQLGESLHLFINDGFIPVKVHPNDPIYIVDAVNYDHLRDLPSYSHPVVFYDSTYSAVMNSNDAQIISLESVLGNPSKNWVIGYSHDPLHGDWHHYLEKYGIENWQTDHNAGIVFTWAPKSLRDGVIAEYPDTIWGFNSEDEVMEWKKFTAERQSGALQLLDHRSGVLSSTLLNHTSGWKVIKSPFMDALTDHFYHVTFDIRGDNTRNVQAKLVEFDSQKRFLETKSVSTLGGGTFGWKSFTLDYTPTDDRTAYVQFQIWHGDGTVGPTPSAIWLDNVAIYDETDHVIYQSLEVPFTTDKTGDYKLLMRYLKNQEGGEIGLRIDDMKFSLTSIDQLNRFTWDELPLHDLRAGQHKIILQNIEGFNAVNLVALVPENDYDQAQDSSLRQLSGKSLLQILNADKDLYYENAILYGTTDKHNKVLRFDEGGRAWQEIEIIRGGTYVLAAKGTGEFVMDLGGKSFSLTQADGFVYSTPLTLSVGKHLLEINANNNSSLDSVWLYSSERANTLDQMFEETNSKTNIISYEKVSPVQWQLSVRSSEPFTITLAEFYDPFWEARIYHGEELIEVAQPTELYGALNGFMINSYGEDLHIIIQYTLQEGFDAVTTIAISGFTICITYLFYDWRRGKGDNWVTVFSAILSEKTTVLLKIGRILNALNIRNTNGDNGQGRLNV
jgi:hypothetical protein